MTGFRVTEQTYDPRLHGVAQLIRLFETARQIPDSAVLSTIDLPLPPKGRDQLVGVTYALDTLRTWAAQLESGAVHLTNDPDSAVSRTPRQLCIERVRFAGDMAHAMQLGFYR